MPPADRKLRIRPPIIVALLLLLIPIGAAICCYLPRYYTYSALGNTVPVREIGVNGSVHFVYVSQGVTRNLFELWSVKAAYPEASFEPADSSAKEVFSDSLDIGQFMRDETIRHAVDSAEDVSGGRATDEEHDAKLDDLLEQTADYYGDSIGLMLGIGLVEETRHEDFSRGGAYNIAGTGTMEDDHTVGSVGAITDKLRTAERDGVDIFFVPKDKDIYDYEGLSNEEEAQLTASELHLSLRVVPVSTLEEAVDYLRNLP